MEGYLKREAMLFRGMDRAIAAAAPGAPPRVLDIGANHGLFAVVAALRGAKVAAVEARVEIKIYGAFVQNRRVALHAIDARPARWRGDAGSSPLDRARLAASSPKNDLASIRRTG